MLLRNVLFVLLASLIVTTVNFGGGILVSAENAPRRHDDVTQLVPNRTRVQFRRAFKRSLVQIFGMEKRPSQRRTTGSGGVSAYMRWLYGESSSGRLSSVLRHIGRRRNEYRQKRHSQATANTVRSFAGI